MLPFLNKGVHKSKYVFMENSDTDPDGCEIDFAMAIIGGLLMLSFFLFPKAELLHNFLGLIGLILVIIKIVFFPNRDNDYMN